MEKRERIGHSTKHFMKHIFIVLICIFAISCRQDAPVKEPEVKKAPAKIPAANADSLYSYVEAQLKFGHRYPSTPGHLKIKNWIKQKMEGYGATVIEQPFKASFYHIKDADAYNIIGSFNPENSNRVLLAAHYDTRIVAEKDADKANQNNPIMGADDGASGVAALLEIARAINENPIDLGVDFIFFDAEDNGQPKISNTWCLGSQHWSRNKHDRNYKASFGILLDMVGAKGASFGKEGFSQHYAKRHQDKIWKLAQRMGYGDYFIDTKFGAIDDDHKYVNEVAGIPMLDIINYDLNADKFAHYHHTHKDDISIIDKRTLRVVSQVVLAALYKTSDLSL